MSTDERGIAEVIIDGENRLICKKKRNSESLAKSIEILLNDKVLRLKMGENGYKKYQNKYTLPIFEDRMKNILMECCNEN